MTLKKSAKVMLKTQREGSAPQLGFSEEAAEMGESHELDKHPRDEV